MTLQQCPMWKSEKCAFSRKKTYRVFRQPCALCTHTLDTVQHGLPFPLHTGRRHYGEMRVCVPSGKFLLLRAFHNERLPGRRNRGKDTPPECGRLLAENAALEGVAKKSWLTHEFCAAKGIEKINGRMFRYIYPLTGEAKEILNSYPQYMNLPYPKDRDLYFAVRTGKKQYTQIPQPCFNRDICRYNPQKYGQAERR